MREYRTSYAAPCDADRLRKPGYVAARIDVAVRQVPTRTDKAMLRPFSEHPAERACLARIGGVDVNHGEPKGLGFVGHKVLQLPEGPTMQPRPDPLTGLDVLPDMGQVLHADLGGSRGHGFRNNGFADLVVHMFDMPTLPTGDSLELALGSAATVGLETTAMGKVNVALVPQLTATPDLASAGSGEIVLPDINPQDAPARNRGGIREIENEVEIPDSLTDYEPGFLRRTRGQQITLMLATHEGNLDTSGQGEQRQNIISDRVGPFVEIDRRGAKSQGRNRPILRDALVGLERLVSIRNPVDRLAHHLATERRELLTDRVIGQVMECDPIPAAMFLRQRHDCAASLGIGIRKHSQRRDLLGRGHQLKRYCSFHIGQVTLSKGQQSTPPPYLPGLNAGVSRRH